MGTTGELERLVLLGLMRLGEGTWGAEVARELEERIGREVGPGTIYPTLDRLERMGLVRSWMGEPTPERGGRARRHYALEPDGERAAALAWAEVVALAEGLEDRLREAAGS